MESVTRKRM